MLSRESGATLSARREVEEAGRVFEEFCAGRPPSKIYREYIGSYQVGVEKMQPYLKRPLRRVRGWAKYEIIHAKGMIDWDKQHEDEFDGE